MIKSEEMSNPESCLNQALDKEFLFVLLARDASAPETLRFWARDRVLRGKNKSDDPIIRDAYVAAGEMERQREPLRKELGKS